jgi:hypothetical protein
LVFLPSARLQEAYAVQLKHQCQSLKSVNLFEGPYLSLLDVASCFSIEADQYEEWLFCFLLHFPFLFGESDPESLCAQRILDTLDFPTQTTEAMSLTVIDVCSLRATIFARFFGVMTIFTLAKTKIIPGFKINMHLRKTQAVN